MDPRGLLKSFSLKTCFRYVQVPFKTGFTVKSKCLRIATNAPWFFDQRQIHEDMDVPRHCSYNRELRFSRCEKPLSSATRNVLVPKGDWRKSPKASGIGGWKTAGQSRSNGHNDLCPALSGYRDRGFRRFSSVTRQTSGYNSKMGHNPHSPPVSDGEFHKVSVM